MAKKFKINPSTVAQKSNEAIGTYHLADNPEIYEPMRSNNFMFIVDPSINQAVKPGYEATDANATVGNAQHLIKVAVSSAFLPNFTLSTVEIKRGNSTLKFAGTPTFNSGNLVLNDYIGAEVKEALLAWQYQAYNVTTEKVGWATDYKKNCTLVEYSPDYQVVRKWKLYGCWISGLTEGDFSSDRNDKMQITATIQYDKAMPDVSDEVA